ncbi:Glu/Leu/Phe/Val family dehydrogenase [Sphingomonas carotinifaciens]|uniref:Amino acid dehydrogenase n=1 Tax=Sphingomonas carotinifaciens TaxID=1166323 RepID=A0A1G7F8S5_9SPHN|nr:Glu/Leu/Phe/Val dehydrogenase dimerization domain-containing protein [Sphingomonas carotinifaciens]MBB4085921.1 leucine dehydrogenase [Sphingomonas carotinifaciens]MWC45309.1 amino acid dehydrogenase [Sphingomonas carotinifaciens]SDE71915.1 leucine dehydrogenase [Sphingomonas carotinifaciens]
MADWGFPDFDGHEGVHLFSDPASGLQAVIAVHSTHLGPAAGGARFWHYATPDRAITDALRLSRGMSYKNAMAGLTLGGGKGVVLAANPGDTITTAQLEAFGRAVESLGGRYVTAEDVGMSEERMKVIAGQTRYVSGLPVASGAAGGDPGPYTAHGVYLGVKAAAKRGLGTDDVKGVRVAIQGVGSVGGGLARLLARDGAILTLADVNEGRAQALAGELGAGVVAAEQILFEDADIVSPNALGAVLHEGSIPQLKAKIVAGGANNQLATRADGRRVHEAGILYAPDYVINAGGIINVGLEYLGQGDEAEVMARIAKIPERLEQVWSESAANGHPASDVADEIAQRLIGR